MKNLFLLVLMIVPFLGQSQVNIDSISHIDYQALHSSNLNDIWGYVDETNIEYALVGASKGTSIVSLQDPVNPVEVAWLPGVDNIWRDIVTWGDYAYVTTEAEVGMQIIDMSPLPSGTSLNSVFYNGPMGSNWSSAHTVYMDENGFAYVMGANRGNGGVIILDVNTDPMNPVEVGTFDNWYVHDGFVRNDTMYLSHISDGFFSIVDVSDKANPVLLGTKTTPHFFTHSSWPNDQGDVVYTTDEISGAFIVSYDITDPVNIVELDRIQSSPGAGIIPHNVFVRGDYLVTSYYSDGVVIHDATNPSNMIEVASFDTYPGQTISYDGAWGVYPYLPSGLILVSDITQGLFILDPTYEKAAYLEGTVTEQGSGNLLDQVSVQIVGHNQTDLSNVQGDYATGILTAGNYAVEYTKVGYFPQTLTVDLLNNQTTVQDVVLVPIPPFNLTITVLENGVGTPIPNAKIRLEADLITHEGTTNALGEEDFTLYYQESYRITVGKWGYVTFCADQSIDNSTGSLIVQLNEGYFDDFELDFGWTSFGTAQTGQWERGVPFATNSGSAPGLDADFDCGGMAYVTGNASTLNPDSDDVDDGLSLLQSPTMNLSTYTDPYINFSRWYYSEFNQITDTMRFFLNDGVSTVQIDFAAQDIPNQFSWIARSIRVADFITPTANMSMAVQVGDQQEENINEGGIDYFFVSEGSVVGVDEVIQNAMSVYPNPATGEIFLQGFSGAKSYEIMDLNGRVLLNGEVSEGEQIDIGTLVNGTYLMIVEGEVFRVLKD
ncbi:MAG: choice-of-anchor B family protein [Bacteroidota bacterium]